MSSLGRWAARALVLATLGGSSPAFAQSKDAVTQARTYFNAGAQAYEAGQFLAAVQAFEQAYTFAPRDAIVFSMAQAYRRQYYVDKRKEHLDKAIKHYRDYLSKVPEGGRRADAAEALAELEPIAERLAAEAAAAAGGDGEAPPQLPPASAASQATRLMVSSQTKGATVTLDGGAPKETPLISVVKPGAHRIRVTANGYFDEERDVTAAEGGILALDIRLRPKPAVLALEVEDGAEISVDGRLVGVAPIAPLELDAGSHFVSVSANGREAWSREVTLTRGQKRTLKADLEVTTQRRVAWVLVGTGVASVAVGALATLAAVGEQSEAQEIDRRRQEENIPQSEVTEYRDHVDARDDFRVVAFGSYVAGALITTTGLFLMSFDQPKLKLPPQRKERPSPDEPAPEEPSMEISAAPYWSPGAAGAGVQGRF